MKKKFSFEIIKKSTNSLARAGIIHTPHGDIHTPAFVTVGTKATVKAMTPEMVATLGAQVVLANTYHLYLEPGEKIVAQGGGLGPFMNWHGPTMTDSGGFQVFSLGEAFGTKVSKVASGEMPVYSDRERGSEHEKMATIDEEGVTFRSYLDGSEHRFTPERSMEIQWDLGADMIFAFDECTSPLAPVQYQREAMDRTHRWAKRSLQRHTELDPENVQALFGVVQGGRFEELRKESAKALGEMKLASGETFDGFGIGGSFNKEDMGTAVRWVNEILPEDKPRHLLGIGEPGDVIEGIQNGCDLFDCVAPTRNARNGSLYTDDGRMNILNAKHKNDFSPVVENCTCYTCQHYSKAYLHHLFRSKEMLASTLATVHNLYYLIHMVNKIREDLLNK
ncbi:MAG: tRNA guanosine(34) transglycosylase Tgt [Candidatus Pacebacteria bacterium]|nr:tRNA guanosine(34) transglycosylase Tgt [Candidatus Paceibacterota bacterium]